MRLRLGAAALLLVLAAVTGCGQGDDPAATTSTRAQAVPFGPTPSDAPEPRRGAPVVAALGDSITAGTPLWNPEPAVRARNPDSVNPQSQYEYWAEARLGGRLRFRNAALGREQRVPVLGFHRALQDPRAPGRMRADLTLEGDHPSVTGYRALGELVARAPGLRSLATEQGPRGQPYRPSIS
jgi:hypothetical protein